MTQDTHTPGPWVISNPNKIWNEAFRIIAQCGHVEVARVSTDGQRNDSLINLANARLIAAAPKLLTALEKLLEHYGETVVDGIGIEHDSQAAHAAIKEARGQS